VQLISNYLNTHNTTTSRTDGQADGRLTISNTALALRRTSNTMHCKNALSKILCCYHANKHWCCPKHEVYNKQLSLTKFFPNNSLLFINSLTFETWSPCINDSYKVWLHGIYDQKYLLEGLVAQYSRIDILAQRQLVFETR